MQRVDAYRSADELANAIDNGGRWFNLLSRPGDRRVTKGELSAAAGWGGDAALYLRMAEWTLTDAERQRVEAILEPQLVDAIRSSGILVASPSTFPGGLSDGRRVIVHGVPRRVEDQTRFGGFIMVPIIAGGVQTMTMIPVFTAYAVWEMSDRAVPDAEPVIVATGRDERLPEGEPLRVAGRVRVACDQDGTSGTHRFVEGRYSAPDEAG